MNPLIPTVLDGVLMAVSTAASLLALAAFVSLVRSPSPAGRRLLVWILVVLFMPILGPIAWFVAQSRERSIESGRGTFGSCGPGHVGRLAGRGKG